MYQATYQAQARPQTAPDYRLAGRQVTRELYEAAQAAKRAGRRVALVILPEHGDELDVPAGVCRNCLGAERLGIEVFVGGPFQDVPGGRSGTGGAEDAGGAVLRPAWHNGAWWQVTRRLASCPVCGQRVVEL